MKAAGDITSYLLDLTYVFTKHLHSYEHWGNWDSNLLLRIVPFPPPTTHIPMYISCTKIINCAVSVFV